MRRMTNTELGSEQTQSPAPGKKISRLPIFLIGGFLLVIIAASVSGAVAGRQMFAAREAAELNKAVQEQYDLAMQDLEAGMYDRARGRLENVLLSAPGFPGAQQALQEALRLMNVTPTPEPTATPVPTATPDLPRAEQMLARAIQIFKDETQKVNPGDRNYQEMITELLRLKVEMPEFKPLRVDGLIFVALRGQGMANIAALRLEEGLYYLALAENYAPLDSKAEERSTWASNVINFYQSAYRFRGRDWEQSIINFSLIYVMAPGYRSNLVTDYKEALNTYLEEIKARGEDSCYIKSKMNEFLAISPNDQMLIAIRDEAEGSCQGIAEPEPIPEETPEI